MGTMHFGIRDSKRRNPQNSNNAKNKNPGDFPRNPGDFPRNPGASTSTEPTTPSEEIVINPKRSELRFNKNKKV